MKEKRELSLLKLMLIITIIFMVGLFLVNMVIFNLAEYIELFRDIQEPFGKVVIISETILAIVLVIFIGLFRHNGYQHTFNIPLKNAPQEFNEIYDDIYSKYNDSLKVIKGNLAILEVFTWFACALAISFFPIVGMCWPSIAQENNFLNSWIFAILLSFLGLPYVALSLRNGKKRDYVEFFKDNCIKEFLREFKFEYFRAALFETGDKLRDVFNKAGCDKSVVMNVQVDGYIVKNIEDKKIELTEACFYNVFNGDKIVIFNGIFGFLKLNKDFNFRLRIKNSELYECNDLRKIELKGSEFTQYFSVYSDDEKLALETLTDEFMQLLVKMYEKYGIQYEININKDLLVIKFYTGKMFQPTIVGESLNKRAFFAYYSITKFAVELMNNTKEYIDRV